MSMQLWRRERDEAGKSVPVQVEKSRLKFDSARRTLLVLPGAYVTDIYPKAFPSEELFNAKMKDLAGCIKGAEIILGGEKVSEKGIDIYAYTYGVNRSMYDGVNTKNDVYSHFQDPDNAKGCEAQDFVDNTLMPLLNEGGDRAHFRPKPSVEELCERLKHVTFVNHSRGSVFMRLVNNSFRLKLSREGYSEAELAEIMPNMVGVNVAPIARIDEVKKPSATMFHFIATNDQTAKNVIANYTKSLDENRQKAETMHERLDSGDDFILDEKEQANAVKEMLVSCGYERDVNRTVTRPLSNGVMVRTELPDALEWTECLEDQCKIQFVDRTLAKDKDNMDVDHNFRMHSIPGTKHPEYARMLRNVVVGAVMREGKLECAEDSQEGCRKLLTTRRDSLVYPPLVDYRKHEKLSHVQRAKLRSQVSGSEAGIGL